MVLLAYYPSVLAGASSVDDSTLLKYLEHMTGWSLRGLFFPAVGGGGYYRPFIGLSFFFDKYVLGLFPGLMHIENVLFHLMNTVLVYFLTLQVIKIISLAESSNSLLPFVAALLFGLHPINSESVNWISGRTDLLAGVFVFSSALCLLNYKESRKKSYIVLSTLTFLCGVLTKESASAFLPGYLLLMSTGHNENTGTLPLNKPAARHNPAGNTAVFISAMFVILAFFFLRSAAFTSNSNRIGMTISVISSDWIQSMLVVLRAFGFYMKKILIPYPLNLAIMEVDPLYEILAVPLVALSIYVVLRRTIISAFFMTGIFLILPAYLIAFGQIAWTPYAERYVYLSSAFITISGVIFMGRMPAIRRGIFPKVILIVIVGTMYVMTLSRSMVWLNDFNLVKDTVEKSSQARDIKTVYASMLIKRGDYELALKQLQQASALRRIDVYDERIDLNLAFIGAKQGKIDEAIDLYKHVLQKTNRQSIVALQNLAILFDMKKDLTRKASDRRVYEDLVMSYNLEVYNLNQDAFLLYKIGNDAASLGQYQKAITLFQKVVDSPHSEDPYKGIAIKRIATLTAYEQNEHVKNDK